MKMLTQLSLAVLVGFALVGNAVAQNDAGSKARGDVYNFWGSQSRQNHAQDHARSLYFYGQTQQVVGQPQAQPVITPVQAQKHVIGVRENLTASQKGLGELKKSNADNKEALAAIAKIEAIHKKVMGHCEMLDKELGKEKTDGATICDCCLDMDADLDAADAEMTKLMKALKIEKLDLPKKGDKPAAPAKP